MCACGPSSQGGPNDDLNFMYAGMVIHIAIAMQVELHRPEFINEFKRIGQHGLEPQLSTRDCLMTWCAYSSLNTSRLIKWLSVAARGIIGLCSDV